MKLKLKHIIPSQAYGEICLTNLSHHLEKTLDSNGVTNPSHIVHYYLSYFFNCGFNQSMLLKSISTKNYF